MLLCALQESAESHRAKGRKICERLSAGEKQISCLSVRQHYFCRTSAATEETAAMNILGLQPILFSISNITKNRTAFIWLDTHRLYNQIKDTSALKLLSKIRISKQEQIVKHNQLITKPHLFTRKFRSLFKTLNQRHGGKKCYCHHSVFEEKNWPISVTPRGDLIASHMEWGFSRIKCLRLPFDLSYGMLVHP